MEHYAHDELHGEIRLLLPGRRDTLLMRGHYTHGERDSVWEWYHGNGQLRRIGRYRYGQPDGPWLALDQTGKLLERSTFREGLFHGTVEYFAPDSTLALQLPYRNGELVPPLLDSPLPNGLLTTGHSFKNDTGPIFWLNSTGKTTAQATLLAGQFHGDLIVYQQVGDSTKVFRVLRFWYGKPNGFHELYAPNGQILGLEEYRYGQATGQWRYFNNRGQLIRSERYEQGQRHGPTEHYHPGSNTPYRTEFFFEDVLVRVAE